MFCPLNFSIGASQPLTNPHTNINRGGSESGSGEKGHCTLHTTRYTLHTTHYTPHYTHCTLHATHYTLHTTHYTLHTTHHTLHHTPHTTHYTLHTTHSTLHTTPSDTTVRLCARRLAEGASSVVAGESPNLII